MMRATAIIVHNNQKLEVFVEKRNDYFEVWMVGPINGRRFVIDHHITHDDLEQHLEYSKASDLAWRDAERSEIPREKHQNAIEYEETIKQCTFLDYLNMLQEVNRSVIGHFGSIGFLSTDRKEARAAKKALLGRWTDGVVTMDIQPNNKLQWSCSDWRHPLNVGEQVHGHAPDWWNFAMWRLHLMNNEHKCGTHVGVRHVDEKELHVAGIRPHRLAHIFRRIHS